MRYARPGDALAPAPTPAFEPSAQQRAIFDWFASGTGNLCVRARAGTGKSSTILAAIEHTPERRILLAAFNKIIADELSTKLRNPRAEARTLHGVGFMFIRKAWPGVRVDDERNYRLARRAWSAHMNRHPDEAHKPIVALVAKLAALGKSVTPLATEPEPLVPLALAHDCVPENGWASTYTVEDVATMALHAMGQAAQPDGTLSFDDMIFACVRNRLFAPAYDMVVIDEAQDLSPAQLLLAVGSASGRIAVVGDDRQSCYQFRGADSGALDRLKSELNAAELPLTTTYRCPRLVVDMARTLVPDYTAAPGAPDGEILGATEEQMIKGALAGDFVLSRVNAPLARICLAILRDGRRARIAGRDVGKGLVALIRRAKTASIRDLLAWVTRWRDVEADKLRGNDSPGAQARLDYLYDQADTIAAIADGLTDVNALVARVEQLFADTGEGSVVCSSIHRGKGLEAARVWLMYDTLYLWGRRRDSIEEANLEYIAVTRSKQTLVLVRTPSKVPTS